MHYRHTHIGYLMIIIFGIVLLLILGRPWSLIGIALFAGCLALFPTLTIEVADGALIWYFGMGLIRKKIGLHDIRKVTVVDTPSRRWSIHPTWFYNVSGPHAVQIELTNGKIIRLGTERAVELATIIENARSRENTFAGNEINLSGNEASEKNE